MDSDKFKISEQNMQGKGVSAQSNPMELPEAEAKAVFDQLVKEVVVPKFNEVLEALEPIDLTSDAEKSISLATQAALDLKVDKEKKTGSTTENKVLSDNNYSDSEKTKLSGVADHANNYVHPATHDASMITGLANLAHNVVDGNNTGAVRTVGAKSNYTMGQHAFAEGVNTVASGIYSHAEGNTTTASGSNSHAEGQSTIASASYAHSEGHNAVASGACSHSEGENTTASGILSHAEGNQTIANGNSSHAEGYGTIASGSYSHAEGFNTAASAFNSHAEGLYTIANGERSHAEGDTTLVSGSYAGHVEGSGSIAVADKSVFKVLSANKDTKKFVVDINYFSYGTAPFDKLSVGDEILVRNTAYAIPSLLKYTIASIDNIEHSIIVNETISLSYFSPDFFVCFAARDTSVYQSAHAEGRNVLASGYSSHAEGDKTVASGHYSHAEGGNTIASGNYSHAEGRLTNANGAYAHAEGNQTISSGSLSHAEGNITQATGSYTHAENYYTTAFGSKSHAEGSYTNSNGEASHAEGNYTTTNGLYSHAEGDHTIASGLASHAEGGGVSTASGDFSHAEGYDTTSSGESSHAEGNRTTASGQTSHAEGSSTQATGAYSHAEGYCTSASGERVHAEGTNTNACGSSSHAEGFNTVASGSYSHAEGNNTYSHGIASHSEGTSTIVSGNYGGHAEGNGSIAVTNKCVFKISSVDASNKKFVVDIGYFSYGTTPFNYLSVGNEILVRNTVYTSSAPYKYTIASIDAVAKTITINEAIPSTNFNPDFFVCFATGDSSTYLSAHAEGRNVLASGFCSHAEGRSSVAIGDYAHAEGDTTNALGVSSHAEGYNTIASVSYSHAEGANTTASGGYAHAEGYCSTASGSCSHAECGNSTASGNYSHAEGYHVTASGSYSHAEGNNTIAGTYALHTQGQYNTVSSGSASAFSLTQNAFVIGNGTTSDAKSNCFRVDFSGNVYGLSAFNSTGADYAEFFEWEDGNSDSEDRRGKFVTLNGDKIKIAQEGDFILGVVSSNPAIIGNHPSEVWKDMYLTDVWGDYIMEWRTIPAQTEMVTLYHDEVVSEEVVVINDEGEEQTTTQDKIVTKTEEVEQVIVDKHQEYLPVTNPDYDPNQTYISRDKRKEWATIGMMGQLIVYTDGSCIVNGFCKCGNGGIATTATEGYRVLKVIDNDKVLILLK